MVPIFRDAALADAFCTEFEQVFRDYLHTDDVSDRVELIFVNDDGSLETAETLRSTCEERPFAKIVNLSRNFGQHVALTCGYDHAAGDFVGMLNVDMQDPPDQIPVMLDAIQDGGHDIVVGVREERESGWFERLTSSGFNWTLNKATGYDIPLNMATLRIMNRRFLNAYRSLTERSRYLPGLEMWLGYDRAYVPIHHQRRTEGTSSYTFRRRMRMAGDAIVSFSDLPLRFSVAVGALIALVGFLLAAYLVAGKLLFADFQPGFTFTVTAVVLLGGVLISQVGVASLYIGRILLEVQGRPIYLVRDTFNFDDQPSGD